MNRAILSPSMMCVSHWMGMSNQIQELHRLGVEYIHMDVMDGVFVQNLMFGTESIKQIRRISPIPLDIHMMIERPEDKVSWFDLQPGEFVSVHVESTRHIQRALSRIRDYGAHPMIALNPGTPLAMAEDVLDDVDAVLIMTVNPGFAGQKLIPQTLPKITRLRTMLDQAGKEALRIEVDGNVSFENAVRMRQAGADMFVCGTSSIFSREGSIAENIARFKQSVSDKEEMQP